MDTSVTASPQKSTTVRSQPMTIELLRLALKTSSVVAPGITDKVTAKLFFRPRRSRRSRVPEVEGIPAKRFTVQSSFGAIAAWSWGEGPLVICAHGWEGLATQFTPFVPPLVRAGFRVVAFDMPAHGKSEGTHVSVVDMAQAIREVAEDATPFLGVDRNPPFAVIGHSLGGTAATLAQYDGLCAQRLVLIAPAAEPTPFAKKAALFLGLSQQRTYGMMRQMVEDIGRDFDSIDARLLARRLRGNALVLHDPQDSEVPFEHGLGIAKAWRGATFVRIEGLGHRKILKDAAVVARCVKFIVGEGIVHGAPLALAS